MQEDHVEHNYPRLLGCEIGLVRLQRLDCTRVRRSIGAIGEVRMNTPASFATGRPLLFDYHLRPNPTDNTTLA